MFKIGEKVEAKSDGRRGTVEEGDRRGSPIPSWAPGCIMVRFDGSGDAITVPTSSVQKSG